MTVNAVNKEVMSMDDLMQLMTLWVKDRQKHAHLRPIMQSGVTLRDYHVHDSVD